LEWGWRSNGSSDGKGSGREFDRGSGPACLDGIVEIVAGIKRRPDVGWIWVLLGGIVSILLGVIIWRQFPLSGIWAIGILLGIKMLFVGIIMITVGSAVRSIMSKT
jgi:uncharacterized membrane protein HdeD (DUF308 family)